MFLFEVLFLPRNVILSKATFRDVYICVYIYIEIAGDKNSNHSVPESSGENPAMLVCDAKNSHVS